MNISQTFPWCALLLQLSTLGSRSSRHRVSAIKRAVLTKLCASSMHIPWPQEGLGCDLQLNGRLPWRAEQSALGPLGATHHPRKYLLQRWEGSTEQAFGVSNPRGLRDLPPRPHGPQYRRAIMLLFLGASSWGAKHQIERAWGVWFAQLDADESNVTRTWHNVWV